LSPVVLAAVDQGKRKRKKGWGRRLPSPSVPVASFKRERYRLWARLKW
jgi:hypothetical protein